MTATKPGLWTGAWARIRLQSFGGGAPTLFLIECTFVRQQGWLDQEELARFFEPVGTGSGCEVAAIGLVEY